MKTIKLISLFALPLLINNTAFSDETYVYCTDKYYNWNWLSNGTVKVQGDWKLTHIGKGIYFVYFKPDNGIEELKMLQKKCIDEFGVNFKYAQPADDNTQRWLPFGLNDRTYLTGAYSNHVSEYFNNSKNNFIIENL